MKFLVRVKKPTSLIGSGQGELRRWGRGGGRVVLDGNNFRNEPVEVSCTGLFSFCLSYLFILEIVGIDTHTHARAYTGCRESFESIHRNLESTALEPFVHVICRPTLNIYSIHIPNNAQNDNEKQKKKKYFRQIFNNKKNNVNSCNISEYNVFIKLPSIYVSSNFTQNKSWWILSDDYRADIKTRNYIIKVMGIDAE